MSYSAISVSQTVISSGTVRKCWKSCNSVSGGLDENGNQVEKPVLTGNYLLDEVIENSDIEAIRNGFEGLTVSTIIDAYIKIIDWFNAEAYGGEPYYPEVTLDNVGEIMDYYNGETYEEYLQRFAEENMDINDIVNSK